MRHDHDAFEMEVVRLSIQNLWTFPWIAERVEAGDLQLAGFRFDIHTGVLTQLVDGVFEAVVR